jgi:hypothetical protein
LFSPAGSFRGGGAGAGCIGGFIWTGGGAGGGTVFEAAKMNAPRKPINRIAATVARADRIVPMMPQIQPA